MRRTMMKASVSKPKKAKKMIKKTKAYASGGGIKVRGTGAATKGLYARGPMA